MKAYYRIKSAHEVEMVLRGNDATQGTDRAGWPLELDRWGSDEIFCFDSHNKDWGGSLADVIQPRSARWEVICSKRFAVMRSIWKPFKVVWLQPKTEGDRGRQIIGVRGYVSTPEDIISVALVLSDDIVGGPQSLTPILLDGGLSAVWRHFRKTLLECGRHMVPYESRDSTAEEHGEV